MKTKNEHILIMTDGSCRLQCDHCGGRRPLFLPVAWKDFQHQTKAFTETHKKCPPPEK